MKKTIKSFALGAIALMMVACATQKDQANNNQRPSGRQGGPPSFSQLSSEMDVNKDGKISKAEAKGPLQNDFSKIDGNSDGFITKTELENAPKPQRGQRPPNNN